MKHTATGRQLMTMQNIIQRRVSTFVFGWCGKGGRGGAGSLSGEEATARGND